MGFLPNTAKISNINAENAINFMFSLCDFLCMFCCVLVDCPLYSLHMRSQIITRPLDSTIKGRLIEDNKGKWVCKTERFVITGVRCKFIKKCTQSKTFLDLFQIIGDICICLFSLTEFYAFIFFEEDTLDIDCVELMSQSLGKSTVQHLEIKCNFGLSIWYNSNIILHMFTS